MLCGALLDMEWPLLVEKVLPLVLYRFGVVWKFVCSEPFGDGLYALLLVNSFGLVEGGFCTAFGEISEPIVGGIGELEICNCASDVTICLSEIWLSLEPLLAVALCGCTECEFVEPFLGVEEVGGNASVWCF